MISSKKSNVVLNSVMLLIGIFIFAMVALFGGYILDDVEEDVLADVTLNESKDVFNEVHDRYPSVFDGLIMFLFIGLWAACVVAAVMSEQHPMIFGFLLFLMVFVVFIAGAFSNFFTDFFADDIYGTTTTSFPMTVWLLTHLVEMIVAITLSIVLALLGKNKM